MLKSTLNPYTWDMQVDKYFAIEFPNFDVTSGF